MGSTYLAPTALRALATAALLALVAPAALAEDAAPPPTAPAPAAPAEEAPEHSAYDMALAKAALPDGWTFIESGEGAADEGALKDQVSGLARDAKVPAEGIHYVTRSASKDGKKAVFLLIDLDAKSDDFAKALADAAKARGWAVRTMGHATRLLVVSAPDDVRDLAVAVQTQYAAKMIAIKAQGALEFRNGQRAANLAHVARQIDEKCATANLVLGIVVGMQALQDQQKPDAALLDKAIGLLRQAVAKDATNPLTGAAAARAYGEMGGLLLNKGGPSAEARDALKQAVKGGADLDRQTMAGYRYNLACAHGRLKEIDEAFSVLLPVLEDNAKDPVQGIEHWRKDPDFENLKADPRWADLLKKYGAEGGTSGQ